MNEKRRSSEMEEAKTCKETVEKKNILGGVFSAGGVRTGRLKDRAFPNEAIWATGWRTRFFMVDSIVRFSRERTCKTGWGKLCLE